MVQQQFREHRVVLDQVVHADVVAAWVQVLHPGRDAACLGGFRCPEQCVAGPGHLVGPEHVAQHGPALVLEVVDDLWVDIRAGI
jgi:hypothetical protein